MTTKRITILESFIIIGSFACDCTQMCIKVHNGSNINNTSFELFDLKNVQY
jgi:hypothetical protein